MTEQQVLSVMMPYYIVQMVVSIPLYIQKKFSLAEKREFFIHVSLLGGFLGLIGYLAVVCHHGH